VGVTGRWAQARERRRADCEAGIGSLEMLGMVTVAALLVAGVVVGVAAYPGQISTALCRFASAAGFGAGGCDAPPAPAVVEGPTDEDFHPGVCMLASSSESYSTAIKIWFVSIGDSSGFVVQEFSDGSVRATLTDGGSIGANGAITSKAFDAGKLGDGKNAGVNVSLGGDLKFEYGSTWEFDSAEQWTSMKDQLDDYLIQQMQLQGEAAAGTALWLWISDGYIEAPKDPKITYSKIGLEAALKASAGTRLGTGSTNADGEEKLLDPKLGFNLSTKASGSVIVMNNHDTGERSYTYEVSGSGAAGGDMILGHLTGEGKVDGAFTTTYDADGQLAKLTFKSAYEYGAGGSIGNNTFKSVSGGVGEKETNSVVTTTTLTVDDTNRDLVSQWMSERTAAGTALTLPLGAMLPDRPSDDPFLQLMYEQAKTSELTYHNVKDSWEFGMAVKKGWEFGFTVSAEEATATATGAKFLGAPSTDGTRALIDDAKCK